MREHHVKVYLMSMNARLIVDAKHFMLKVAPLTHHVFAPSRLGADSTLVFQGYSLNELSAWHFNSIFISISITTVL